MDFSLSEDHRILRDAALEFLSREADLAPFLVPAAAGLEEYSDRLWQKQCELGWPGMAIPEDFGGLGMTLIDLALVLQASGRHLAPSPLLGTLLGTWAIISAGSDQQKARFLPEVAVGDRRLAVGLADATGDHEGSADLPQATSVGGNVTLTGRCRFVVDGQGADTLVVAGLDAGERRLFLVDGLAAGLTCEPEDWRDITRTVCRLTLDQTPAELMIVPSGTAWPFVRDRFYLALASESAAGLQKVLEDTTAYAKERVAFGRLIGAYQAIKHHLADMLAQSEAAATAVLYAAWALNEGHEDAALAAAMAQSFSSEAYREATHRSIQIFGAVGFTWEMPNHLYYKRARGNAVMAGPPEKQREELVRNLIERRSREQESNELAES